MKTLRILAAFVAASIALAGLTTCKHDLHVTDIEGYWDLFLTPEGGPEIGPVEVFYIQQTGTGLDCSHGFAGSIEGSSVYLESGVEPDKVVLSGTVSGEVISGGYAGAPLGSGTFRMERSTMIFGHLDLEGTCQGEPIVLDTEYALGAGGVPDVGGTRFDLFHDDNTVRVWLGCGFPGATPPVGPYSWQIGLNWDSDAGPDSGEIDAESGTMTITRFDGTGVAGEFSASFAGGDTITGSFDVSFNEWGM